MLQLLFVLVLVERRGHAGRLVEGLGAVGVAELRALLHDLGPDDALFHGLEQVRDRLAHDDGVQLRDGEVRLQPLGGGQKQVGAEHRERRRVHEALHDVVEVRHDLIEAGGVAEHHVLVAGALDPHVDLVGVAVLHGLEHRGDVRHVPAQDALVLDGAAALHDLLLGEQAGRVAQLVLAGGRRELLQHGARLLDVAHEELQVQGTQGALLGLHVLVDAHALHDAGLAVRVGVDLKGALDLLGIEPADLGALLKRPLLAGLLQELAARGALHAVDLVGAEQRRGEPLVHGELHDHRGVLLGIPYHIVGIGAGQARLGRLQREARLGVDKVGHVRPGAAEVRVVLLVLEDPADPGEQQGRIGAGADGQPYLGLGGVQGVAGVDDHGAQALRAVAQLGQGAAAGGHRGVGWVGAPKHERGHRTVGIVVVPAVGVGERQVVGLAGAVGQKRGAHAGQVALRAARLPHIGGVDGLAEALHVREVRVSATARGNGDGLGAVLVGHFVDLGRDLGERLLPRDALPLVGSSLAHAAHGVLVAVRVIERLDAGKALGAHAALGHGAFRISLDLHDTAVPHMGQHRAAGDARAAGRLDDLHVRRLVGMGRINRREAIGRADAQRSRRSHGRRGFQESATRHSGSTHKPSPSFLSIGLHVPGTGGVTALGQQCAHALARFRRAPGAVP